MNSIKLYLFYEWFWYFTCICSRMIISLFLLNSSHIALNIHIKIEIINIVIISILIFIKFLFIFFLSLIEKLVRILIFSHIRTRIKYIKIYKIAVFRYRIIVLIHFYIKFIKNHIQIDFYYIK